MGPDTNRNPGLDLSYFRKENFVSKPKPRISYLICTTPRSGSWLLSEALQATGLAGRPREYFAPELQGEWQQKWGVPAISSYADFAALAIRNGTTSNGVFGSKVHWYQFEHLAFQLRGSNGNGVHSDADLIANAFPNVRYVWLFRRDKVRQAVSYYRASSTGQWWNIQSPGDGDSKADSLRFDFRRIDELRNTLLQHESRWRRFFRESRIDPIKISYEDLNRDYQRTTMSVLDAIGVDIPEDLVIARPRLRRQADEMSESWISQYRQLKTAAAAQLA